MDMRDTTIISDYRAKAAAGIITKEEATIRVRLVNLRHEIDQLRYSIISARSEGDEKTLEWAEKAIAEKRMQRKIIIDTASVFLGRDFDKHPSDLEAEWREKLQKEIEDFEELCERVATSRK